MQNIIELLGLGIGIIALIISVYLLLRSFSKNPKIVKIVPLPTKNKPNEFQMNVLVTNDGERDLHDCKCSAYIDKDQCVLYYVPFEYPSAERSQRFELPAKRERWLRGYIEIPKDTTKMRVILTADGKEIKKEYKI